MYNPHRFCNTFIPSPIVANLFKSGVVDKAALGFLLTAALHNLLAIFNALTGLLATFFQKLSVASPTLLKNLLLPQLLLLHH